MTRQIRISFLNWKMKIVKGYEFGSEKVKIDDGSQNFFDCLNPGYMVGAA